MGSDLWIIFKVYLISLGLQFLLWPLVSKLFKVLLDKGWALGRVFGVLSISLPIWFTEHFFPVNTKLAIILMILLLSLISLRFLQNKQSEKLNKIVILEEVLFASGLIGLSIIRGFQPNILGLEKFMDFGFIKQYFLTSKLPAPDMWLAGSHINYYSFGHFLTSILIKIWGVQLGVGYNLMLGWILGTSLALSFSLLINLESGFIGSIMGAFLTCLGGNSHILWYLIKHKNLEGYWYADATRFIYHTIHEFPAYSFVVSDIHAHLLDLPFVLVFILLLVWLNKTLSVSHGIVLGVLIGVMAMTNTWDVAVYSLLLLIFILMRFFMVHNKFSLSIFKLTLVTVISFLITVLPWALNFHSFSGGIKFTSIRSPLWQMAVLWGGHLIVTVLALIMLFKSSVNNKITVISALIITAFLLLIIPEIIYLQDIYTSHPRANTMFKLTYQSFIIMSLLFGWVIGQIKSRQNYFLLFPLFILWSGLMYFPIPAFNSYYGGFRYYQGLDGLSWLRNSKNKWGIINYLETHQDGRNMVEAVGDSYSTLNSISAFSGTPTVLGWRVHEWLWQGGYSLVEERGKLVKHFYENGDIESLKNFNVGWVVIGKNERKKYQVNEQKLLPLGHVVLRNGKNYLLRLF